MKILEHYDLSKLNTFGVFVFARYFAEVHSEEEFLELTKEPVFRDSEKLFLGGGSNVLFTKDFDGIVILNKIEGIEITDEAEEGVTIQSKSGTIWHDLVTFAVERGYWGIENLSLIPGSVGAAPMQNIGAYGAELKNTLLYIEAYDILTGEKRKFSKEECELGYRDSIFKNSFKNKYFITDVVLRLSKKENKNISYKVLSNYLKENNINPTTSKEISDAVADIRRSKLPDPKVIGNAGSFFKNVFLNKEKLNELLSTYPDMPYFEEDSIIKIPSAWLIEQCGWKGKRVGNVGVHDKQALVLVNHGEGKGEEIKQLADEIIKSVYLKFGLNISPEVNLI